MSEGCIKIRKLELGNRLPLREYFINSYFLMSISSTMINSKVQKLTHDLNMILCQGRRIYGVSFSKLPTDTRDTIEKWHF